MAQQFDLSGVPDKPKFNLSTIPDKPQFDLSNVPDTEVPPEGRISLVGVDNSNIIDKGWKAISEPPEIVTKTANELADKIDNPLGEGGYLKGFGAGAIQGAASLLSPLNIAQTVLPQSRLTKLMSGGQVVEGVDQLRKGNYGTGAADIALGALGMKSKITPKVAKIEPVVEPPPISPNVSGELPPLPVTPIERLNQAIKIAKNKLGPQAISLTEQRAERLRNMEQVTTTGLKGSEDRMATLAGKYDRIGLPPIGPHLQATDIDDIINLIQAHPVKDKFVKIHAEQGFKKLLRGELPQPEELKTLNNILGTSIEVPGEASIIQPPSLLRQLVDIPRAFKSTDIPFMTSAATRQASPLFGTRRWFQAYGKAMQSYGSQKTYDAIHAELENSIIHKKRMIAGPAGEVEFKSVADELGIKSSDLKLGNREEQIKANVAEKIPLLGAHFRASNRAFTAFMNVVRTKTAEDWLKAANVIDEHGMVTDLYQAKKLANTLNELTGHGSLKIGKPGSRFTNSGKAWDLERNAGTLSDIFFSPRLMARDARMMNPLNYMKNDKLVRMKYLAGAIRRAGAWATFTGLAAMGGATVISDPTSSDFGKAIMGDTRMDAGSGLLQWIVLGARQLTGQSTSSSTGRTTNLGSSPVARTRMDVGSEFLQNRVNPLLAPVVSAMTASKGKPFYPGSEAAESITPFPIADLQELIKNDPELESIVMSLGATTLSLGTATYGRGDFTKPQYDVPGDVKFTGGPLSLFR
jgi:hypothetical protein